MKILYKIALAALALSCGGDKKKSTPSLGGGITYDLEKTVVGEVAQIAIKSSVDDTLQNMTYRKASKKNQPLLVYLHSWGGDYTQNMEPIDKYVADNDLNYLIPDSRGPNDHADAFYSDLVYADINDAVAWAKVNLAHDENRVFVIGYSGGGGTALGLLTKKNFKVSKLIAWASLLDLGYMYDTSELLGDADLLDEMKRGEVLDREVMKQRSPITKLANDPTVEILMGDGFLDVEMFEPHFEAFAKLTGVKIANFRDLLKVDGIVKQAPTSKRGYDGFIKLKRKNVTLLFTSFGHADRVNLSECFLSDLAYCF